MAYKENNACQSILNTFGSRRTSDIRPRLVVRNRTTWKEIARADGGYDWVIVDFEKPVGAKKQKEITEDIFAEVDKASKVSVDMSVVSEQVSINQGRKMGDGPMTAREETKMSFQRMFSSADQVYASRSLSHRNHDLAESDKPKRSTSAKDIDDVARGCIRNKLLRKVVRVATGPTDVMPRETSATSSSSIQKESSPTEASINTLVLATPKPRQRDILQQAMLGKTSQLKPVAVPTSKAFKPSNSRPKPSIGAIRRILAHDLGVKLPTNRKEALNGSR